MVPKNGKTAKFSLCAIKHSILVLKLYGTIMVWVNLNKQSSFSNVKIRVYRVNFELKVKIFSLVGSHASDTPSSFIPVHPVRQLPISVVIPRQCNVNCKVLAIIVLEYFVSIQAIFKSLIPSKSEVIRLNHFIRGCLI